MQLIRISSNFILCIVLLLGTGCTQTPTATAVLPTPTSAPTSTPLPSATPTQTQQQIELTRLQALGFNNFEIQDENLVNSEGNPIHIDSLDVITAPSNAGLTWWNPETGNWSVVDPINPETYPMIYLEHWNSLATRTPVSEPTAEDIAFNDFQIETYRLFFPSIQSALDQDPLWQTFFQTNGSDFSVMTNGQIHQASLLYGQTSKEVIMPIVLLEQQNHANPNNWKFSYETSTYDGIILDTNDPTADKQAYIEELKESNFWWGFDQNYFGTIIHVDNITIDDIRGIIQAQFRVPGVDPDVEVGLVISFDNGRHLNIGVSFQEVSVQIGDKIIYRCWEPVQSKSIRSSSFTNTYHPISDQWIRKITPQQLQKYIGSSRSIGVRLYSVDDDNCTDIFSKSSGLQLAGMIFTTINRE